MPDKELKKLNRAELLELLVKLSEENETLAAEKATLQQLLDDKNLRQQEAGSIAEAALQVSGIFEDAQNAAALYLENIKQLNDNVQIRADELLDKTQSDCQALEAEVQAKCESMTAQAKARSEEMIATAEKESNARWASLQERLDTYCAAHEGLKEQLGSLLNHQK